LSRVQHHRRVHAEKWASRAFLTAGGLQVAGLYLDLQLMPYAGTLALTALLAFALAMLRTSTSWPSPEFCSWRRPR
jgi:hypothetical protein